MPFQEDAFEFAQRHGRKQISAEVNGRECYLFADGAMVDVAWLNRREPPTDPVHALPLKKIYHEAWVARLRKDFALLKSTLLGEMVRTESGMISPARFVWPTNDYGCPGPADGKDGLKLIAALEREHKAALAKATADYEAIPSVRAMNELHKRNRELSERSEQIRQENAARERRAIDRIRLSEDAHADV